MAMTLHQALKSLCLKPGWCYAVFWKLKRRSRMVLSWEDGYCDYVKPQSAPNLSCFSSTGNHIPSESNGMYERHCGSGVEDRIGLAVAKMSYHVYSLGEGIIGHVAFTGKHQWIFGDRENTHAEEADVRYPAGWACQFSAGIKTIAVVAVPQGVVQLGSTYLVMEDMNLVHRIRSLFTTLQNGSQTHISKAPDAQNGVLWDECIPLSLPIIGSRIAPVGTDGMTNLNLGKFRLDGLVEAHRVDLSSYLGDTLGFTGNGNSSKRYAHQSQFLNTAEALRAQCETYSHHSQNPQFIQPLTSSSDVSSNLGANSLYNLKNFPDGKYSVEEGQYNLHLPVLQTNTAENLAAIATSSHTHVPSSESLKVDSFEAMTPFGECQGWEQFNLDKSTLLSLDEKFAESIIPMEVGGKDSKISFSGVYESFDGNWLGLDSPDDIDVFVASLAKDGCKPIEASSLNLAHHDMCDELSEILAPAYRQAYLQDDTEESDENRFLKTFASIPLQSCAEQGLSHSLLSSSSLKQETSLSETKVEPLLEAVVAGLSHTPKSLCPNSIASSSYQTSSPTPHTLAHNASFRRFDMGLSVVEEESKIATTHVPFKGLNFGESVLSGRSYETDTEASIKLHLKQEISETSSSVQAIGGQKQKSQGSVVTESLSGKRAEESTKGGKKRVRPGEVSRPRPKDRQQIQDRVRELREIVPNGAKCSIDALLERTIKHLHFLQTVTQHGGNWKSVGEKGQREHDSNILGTELDNGASWALELGGQGMGCPIVVENMNQPGQLLVEMMFDEKGLFLEIADTIRGLGLTILKGVMEARNGKIQARFIVEVARDVHRVEVLWSLTQLLQPTTASHSTITSQGCLV